MVIDNLYCCFERYEGPLIYMGSVSFKQMISLMNWIIISIRRVCYNDDDDDDGDGGGGIRQFLKWIKRMTCVFYGYHRKIKTSERNK